MVLFAIVSFWGQSCGTKPSTLGGDANSKYRMELNIECPDASVGGLFGVCEKNSYTCHVRKRMCLACLSCDSNTVRVAGAPTLFHGFNSGNSILIYMTTLKVFTFFFSISQIETGSSNCLCKFPLFQKQPLGGADKFKRLGGELRTRTHTRQWQCSLLLSLNCIIPFTK